MIRSGAWAAAAVAGAAAVVGWLLGASLWAAALAVVFWCLALWLSTPLRILVQALAPWPLLATLPLDTLFSWRVAVVAVVAVAAWTPLFASLGRSLPVRMVPLFVLVPLVGVVAMLLVPVSLPFVAGDVATRAQVVLVAAWALLLMAATPHALGPYE